MSDAATAVTDRDVRCRRALRLLLGTGTMAAIWWVLMTGTAHAATASQERGDSGPLGRSVSHVVHHVTGAVAKHEAPGRSHAEAHPVRRAATPAAPAVHHATRTVQAAVQQVTGPLTSPVTSPMRDTTRSVTKAAEPLVTQVVEPVVGPVAQPVGDALVEPVVDALVDPVVTTLAGGTRPGHAASVKALRTLTGVLPGVLGDADRNGPAPAVRTPADRATPAPATPRPGRDVPTPSYPTPGLGSGSAVASAVLADDGHAPTPSRSVRPLDVTFLRPLERAYPPGSSPD